MPSSNPPLSPQWSLKKESKLSNYPLVKNVKKQKPFLSKFVSNFKTLDIYGRKITLTYKGAEYISQSSYPLFLEPIKR